MRFSQRKKKNNKKSFPKILMVMGRRLTNQIAQYSGFKKIYLKKKHILFWEMTRVMSSRNVWVCYQISSIEDSFPIDRHMHHHSIWPLFERNIKSLQFIEITLAVYLQLLFSNKASKFMYNNGNLFLLPTDKLNWKKHDEIFTLLKLI